MKNYLKDNTHRYKREKEIDDFIYNEYKKKLVENKEEMMHLRKINQIELNRKRFREEALKKHLEPIKDKECLEETEEKNEKCKEKDLDLNQDKKENDQDVNSKIEKGEVKKENKVNFKFALEKLLKHISKEDHFTKCLNLIKTLLINNNEFNPLVIIKIFIKIMGLDFKFNDKNNRKTLEDIFDFIVKDFESKSEEEKNKIENFESFIKTFSLLFKNQINLLTDDSFKFNTSMKKLEETLNSLPIFREKEVENYIYFVNILEGNCEGEDIYTNDMNEVLNKIDIGSSVDCLKKKIFIGSLRQSLANMKLKWAFPSIDNIIKLCYYSKNKFSETEFKQIENINNIFKNKIVASNNLDNSRIYRDDKIKNNPLEASHQVTDARSERTVVSGLDTWASKQTGLSYGKMFIN